MRSLHALRLVEMTRGVYANVFSLLCHQNLAALVDIDALALWTAVCNHAVQADIAAVVVILTRYADNASLQVEVEPFFLGYAVDNIVIRSFSFSLSTKYDFTVY